GAGSCGYTAFPALAQPSSRVGLRRAARSLRAAHREARGAVSKPASAKRVESPPRAPSKAAALPRLVRSAEDGKFDRLVSERVRLGMMSALAVNESMTFTELKALFDVSDGNLSAHARKLEEAG